MFGLGSHFSRLKNSAAIVSGAIGVVDYYLELIWDYQIFTRFSGAIYIASPGFTS